MWKIKVSYYKNDEKWRTNLVCRIHFVLDWSFCDKVLRNFVSINKNIQEKKEKKSYNMDFRVKDSLLV